MAAINFTTLKNTDQETIIKFQGGAADTGTITIAGLTSSTQARNIATPTVNIVKLHASGLLTSGLVITRNSVAVVNCAPEHSPMLDYTSFAGISDSVNNTYDLAFTISGAATTGYIVLRKIAGWSLKVETAAFGIYDSTSTVGS
jgi:hypothetical protein